MKTILPDKIHEPFLNRSVLCLIASKVKLRIKGERVEKNMFRFSMNVIIVDGLITNELKVRR